MEARKYLKKFLPHYVHHRNYINKGNGEATTIRHIVQMILLAKIAFTWLPYWSLIPAGIMIVSIYWSIGKGWDWLRGYDVEHEWSNDRNPTIQHIKRKV